LKTVGKNKNVAKIVDAVQTNDENTESPRAITNGLRLNGTNAAKKYPMGIKIKTPTDVASALGCW
jgi:hypothetical protein